LGLLDTFKKPEIYKFLLVGAIGSLILFFLTIFFTSIFEIFYVISTVIAFEISLIWSFFINDKWTFGKSKKTSKRYVRFVKYNFFALISLGIIQAVMITLVTVIDLHYSYSQAVGIIVAFFFNFFSSKHISFKN